MRTNWILSLIFTALFVNILILYWLVYNLFVTTGEFTDPTAPVLLRDMFQTQKATQDNFTSTDLADKPVIDSKEIVVTKESESAEEIKKLQDSIEAVNNKVEELKANAGGAVVLPQKSTVIQVKNSVREVTVPLGNGQTDATDWVDIPGMNAYVDSTNYGSVTSVRFEAVVRIPNASGFVHARLYNVTGQHPVWNSEVVSETDAALLKDSGPIVLDGGNNLYQVQMKSTIGHLAIIDSGRIKIFVK
jgi:hypothetical protein